MNTKTLYQILKPLENVERQNFMADTAPTSKQVLGLSMPELRATLKPIFSDLKKTPALAKESLMSWIQSNNFELCLAAFLYLDTDKKLVKALSKGEVLSLNQGLDNWVLIDYYGTIVTGFAWKHDILSFSDIEKWLYSENPWERRLAITSCLGLDRGSKTYTKSSPYIEQVCFQLAQETDHMIYQAISWVLRFHISRDRGFVEEFMAKNGHKFHPKVQKEVATKLNTGKKN